MKKETVYTPSGIVIGVLACMGTKSTPTFLEKIIDYCQELYGATSDSDFPDMIVYSLPTPSFSADGIIDHISMKNCLKKGIESLKRAKIDFLAIPSNFAHIYYEYITSIIEVPVLHIVKETIKLMSDAHGKPAIFGTNATLNSGIYQDELKKIGIPYFHNDALQDNVSELIISIKQTGISSHTKKLWNTLYEYCEQNNCDSIISACTDLTPCLKHNAGKNSLFIMDSTDALALASVKKFIKLSKDHSMEKLQASA